MSEDNHPQAFHVLGKFGTQLGGVLGQPLQVGNLVHHVKAGCLCQQVLVGGCTPGLVWVGCWCRQELVGDCTPGLVSAGCWSGQELLLVSGLCQLLAQGWASVFPVSGQGAYQCGCLGLCVLGCTFSETFCS